MIGKRNLTSPAAHTLIMCDLTTKIILLLIVSSYFFDEVTVVG